MSAASRGRRPLPVWRRFARYLALAVAVAVGIAAPIPRHSARAVPAPPSVVVILTDDQRWDTLSAMPTVQSDLVQHGTTFTNAFVSNSLCCPSRTSILTGDYSHTTGVWRNQPPYGGWSSFNDSSTIATHLQADGYRTGLFGKYLNGYEPGASAGYVPPGWDRWVAFPRAAYYDYQLSVDGAIQSFGSTPAEYSTDVLASQATSFIRSSTGPMFVYFAPFAPHSPATPAVTHASDFSGLSPWRPVSYDEKDMSDKPAWAQRLTLWDASKRAQKDAFHIDQYRSLQSVDEAVGQIVQALQDTGRLSNTMIVFMSDNGLSWGEHRWGTKRVAYEEAIRIPMVIRFDPVTSAARLEDRIALNIDIAPTIFDLVGVSGVPVDGQSLLPLVAGAPVPWRHDFLLEHLEKPIDRLPTYCGIRTERYTYVYYVNGEQELYDLRRDPYELQNEVSNPAYADEMTALQSRLAGLCSPPPPGLTLPW
jgi:N-acetylglucosamine-6-sulfatase